MMPALVSTGVSWQDPKMRQAHLKNNPHRFRNEKGEQ